MKAKPPVKLSRASTPKAPSPQDINAGIHNESILGLTLAHLSFEEVCPMKTAPKNRILATIVTAGFFMLSSAALAQTNHCGTVSQTDKVSGFKKFTHKINVGLHSIKKAFGVKDDDKLTDPNETGSVEFNDCSTPTKSIDDSRGTVLDLGSPKNKKSEKTTGKTHGNE